MADVVPLLGENRRLVKAGLRAIAGTRKPGLRALMEIARVDPGTVDAGAIGFRLAPRINAAGRLHRADAGLELLLTEDPARGRAIAAELDAVNAERRDVETRIRFAAEAQVAEQGPAAAYVLASEDWHPGVIGIVAARIAERHHRPAVLIALEGDEGTGSGRSIPAFDLLGGLTAASRHLERYGGHRAAAGLTIAREHVGAFREAFAAHAADVLTPADLAPELRIDAVAPGGELTLGLAEELERLGPFGQGNPPVSLLVPAAHLADPRAMGEGRHVAFTLHAGGATSRCVQFGSSRVPGGARRARRRGGAARGQPLERLGRAPARAPARPPEPPRADRGDRRARVRRRAAARARARPGRVGPRAGRDRAARARRGTGVAGLLTDLVEHRGAGAGARGPRAAPRARAERADRRLRALLVGGARGRPRPGRRVRPSGRRRPAAQPAAARPFSNTRPSPREPIWRGVRLSYALPDEYTSGTSPCATR